MFASDVVRTPWCALRFAELPRRACQASGGVAFRVIFGALMQRQVRSVWVEIVKALASIALAWIMRRLRIARYVFAMQIAVPVLSTSHLVVVRI